MSTKKEKQQRKVIIMNKQSIAAFRFLNFASGAAGVPRVSARGGEGVVASFCIKVYNDRK